MDGLGRGALDPDEVIECPPADREFMASDSSPSGKPA